MPDAYDQAVEYLTANPGNIKSAWGSCYHEAGGCLFHYVCPGHDEESAERSPRNCGCLSMIRMCRTGGDWVAVTPELTAAIKADERLPDANDVTVDHLPIFAGWQRRIDKVLNRTPPALDPRLPMPTGDIEIPEPTTRTDAQCESSNA